jgi:NADH dehydrogenase
MAAQRILVLGGGYAGLWSAIGAARRLDEGGVSLDQVEVLLFNRDRIVPLLSGNRQAILDAAAPTLQPPPRR